MRLNFSIVIALFTFTYIKAKQQVIAILSLMDKKNSQSYINQHQRRIMAARFIC